MGVREREREREREILFARFGMLHWHIDKHGVWLTNLALTRKSPELDGKGLDEREREMERKRKREKSWCYS